MSLVPTIGAIISYFRGDQKRRTGQHLLITDGPLRERWDKISEAAPPSHTNKLWGGVGQNLHVPKRNPPKHDVFAGKLQQKRDLYNIIIVSISALPPDLPTDLNYARPLGLKREKGKMELDACKNNSSSSNNLDEEDQSTMVRRVHPKEEEGNSPPLHSILPARSNKRRCVSSACIPCRKRKSKVSGGFDQVDKCLYTSTRAVTK